MPGMIVLAHDIEEAFLDLHLPGDEEQSIGEKGTYLCINFLNGPLCFIREDDFAMLLVIAGIAIHVDKANVRFSHRDTLPPSAQPCALILRAHMLRKEETSLWKRVST